MMTEPRQVSVKVTEHVISPDRETIQVQTKARQIKLKSFREKKVMED